jgi:hypothetical protein
MNYRVGALGFLAGREVESNGALNAGLLDQRKALQWVRKYIAQVRVPLDVFRYEDCANRHSSEVTPTMLSSSVARLALDLLACT